METALATFKSSCRWRNSWCARINPSRYFRAPPKIVAIVGANAAGKSTTINVISGLVRATAGQVELEGTRIDRLPAHRIVERGVVQIPEGRQLFPYMTVEQNLEMGAYTPAARAQRQETLEEVFALLPVLRDRRSQLAGPVRLHGLVSSSMTAGAMLWRQAPPYSVPPWRATSSAGSSVAVGYGGSLNPIR